MLDWIDGNGLTVMIGYYIFISITSSLPKAEDVESSWGKFGIRFLNTLAGNADKLFGPLKQRFNSKKEGRKNK